MNNLNVTLDSQNLDQCIKTIENFGHNELRNICTGKIEIIPWGSMDWIGLILFTITISLLVVMIVYSFLKK